MSLARFLHWLSETGFSATLRESTWVEPIFETVHVLTLTLFLGFSVLLDLRLLGVVFGARAVRFSLVGLAAIWLNREILRIANSQQFAWFMEGFTALCVIGSIASIIRWVRLSRSQSRRRAAA